MLHGYVRYIYRESNLKTVPSFGKMGRYLVNLPSLMQIQSVFVQLIIKVLKY